jgi:hypothetical protein
MIFLFSRRRRRIQIDRNGKKYGYFNMRRADRSFVKKTSQISNEYLVIFSMYKYFKRFFRPQGFEVASLSWFPGDFQFAE